MSRKHKKKSLFEWIELVIKLVGTVVIPLVIWYVGQSYTNSQFNSKTKSEYIKIGVSLLAIEPSENDGPSKMAPLKKENHR